MCAKQTQQTLGDILGDLRLRKKHVAVIGPNIAVNIDPSPLFFAQQCTNGQVTIIDRKPMCRQASIGNINAYMHSLQLAQRRYSCETPKVHVADFLQTTYPVDVLFECMTFKCIMYDQKASWEKTAIKLEHAIRRCVRPSGYYVSAYHNAFDDLYKHITSKFTAAQTTFIEDCTETYPIKTTSGRTVNLGSKCKDIRCFIIQL